VLIGGLPAARKGDATICLGPASTVGGGGGGGGDGGSGTPKAESECAKLWKKYQQEAENIIKPGDHDHRERNKIISGAYADLYLKDRTLVWAGLAAYASKQVGCAMDHSQRIAQAGDPPAQNANLPVGQPYVPGGMKASGEYVYNKLGEGNRALFLDIYPVHRFYQEQGYAKLAKCAGERVPPLPAQLLDSFRALDMYKRTGDKKYLRQHLASAAMHEQINILQSGVYNDPLMQGLLRSNETGLPMTSPASVVMGSGCKAKPGDHVSKFDNGKRTRIYSVPERMDWILNDIGGYYLKDLEGTPKMRDDLEGIRRQGRLAGGNYP
jgi:hypothetical protein